MTARLQEQMFENAPEAPRDQRMERYLRTLIGQSVQFWQQDSVVEGDSYGIVVKVVRKDGSAAKLDLDNPGDLYDFAFGHGEYRRFLYRALCKQRAVVRTGVSTAELGQTDFEDVRTDADMDGSDARLGEYPHRGGVVVEDETYQVYVAMSGASGKQDHAIAAFLGEMTLLKLEELDEAEAALRQTDQPVATAAEHAVSGD